MDILGIVLTWQDAVKILGGVWTVLSVINAAMKDSPQKSFLSKALNFLSFLLRDDAKGTLKLPLSHKPLRNGIKAPLNLVPIFLIGLSVLNGCAFCQVPSNKSSAQCKALVAVEQCGPQAAAVLLSVLPDIIAGNNDVAFAVIKRQAPAEYECIIQAITQALMQKYGPGSKELMHFLKAANSARTLGKGK